MGHLVYINTCIHCSSKTLVLYINTCILCSRLILKHCAYKPIIGVKSYLWFPELVENTDDVVYNYTENYWMTAGRYTGKACRGRERERKRDGRAVDGERFNAVGDGRRSGNG